MHVRVSEMKLLSAGESCLELLSQFLCLNAGLISEYEDNAPLQADSGRQSFWRMQGDMYATPSKLSLKLVYVLPFLLRASSSSAFISFLVPPSF